MTRFHPRRRAHAVRSVALTVLAVLLAAPAVIVAAQPAVATTVTNVAYGADPAQKLDVLAPTIKAGTTRPVIVTVHGGGWATGDKGDVGSIDKTFYSANFVTVNINYRLVDAATGSNLYPAPVDDVRLALVWVRANIAVYGGDPTRIGVWGESAGGHLAAMMNTEANVKGIVSWSGPMDLPLSYTDPFLGGKQQRVIDLFGCDYPVCPTPWTDGSPVTHVAAGQGGVQLINSTAEAIPVSQARSMQTALTNAGVPVEEIEVPGATHGWGFSATGLLLPDGRTPRQAAVDWFRVRL